VRFPHSLSSGFYEREWGNLTPASHATRAEKPFLTKKIKRY
jgi:hypothetical protein